MSRKTNHELYQRLHNPFSLSFAKHVDCFLIFFVFFHPIFMNINIISWWGLFAGVRGLEEKTKLK